MKTDRKPIDREFLIAVVLGTLGAALAMACLGSLLLTGCAAPGPQPQPQPGGNTNGIANLSCVEPSVWRGGQPDLPGWQWLARQGISNVIKLDTSLEGDDSGAELDGMKVYRLPIDSLQQLVTGPDPDTVRTAVSLITAGTYVHCLHGEDRTGLIVGLYRLTEGTNAAAAYAEMRARGFHPALHGLQSYWDRASSTNHTVKPNIEQ